MSTTIGTIFDGSNLLSFNLWLGQVSPRTNVVDRYRRMGQLGSSSQILGLEAPVSRVPACYLTTTMADAALFRLKVVNLPGVFVNITEPTGIVWTGALMREGTTAKITQGVRNLGGVSYPLCVDCMLMIEAQP